MTEKGDDMKRIWVTIGIFIFGTICSVVTIAWTGGGRVTSVEKDIEVLKTSDIKQCTVDEKQNARMDAFEDALIEEQKRNIRVENQYSVILNYMEKGEEADRHFVEEQKKQTEEIILIKEKVNNLERAD